MLFAEVVAAQRQAVPVRETFVEELPVWIAVRSVSKPVARPGPNLQGPAPMPVFPKTPGQRPSHTPKLGEPICWALSRGYQNRFVRERRRA